MNDADNLKNHRGSLCPGPDPHCAVLTFLSCVAGAVCIVACVGLSLLAILCLLAGQTVGCIAMFVLAFWFPPLGSRPWAAGWWSACME